MDMKQIRTPAAPPQGGLKIETDVPLPPCRGMPALPNAVTLAKRMTVGASVLFDQQRQAGSLSRALQSLFGNGSYAQRKVAGGWRVWRLK